MEKRGQSTMKKKSKRLVLLYCKALFILSPCTAPQPSNDCMRTSEGFIVNTVIETTGSILEKKSSRSSSSLAEKRQIILSNFNLGCQTFLGKI